MAISKIEPKRNRRARELSLTAAATKLFASKGFEATTTREIAVDAGCSEGLIHRYFGGKDGLLLAIVRDRASHEAEDFRHTAWPAATIEEELVQLVEWEMERAWSDREFLKVVLRQSIVDNEFSKSIRNIVLKEKSNVIQERMRRFREGRDLPAEELEALAHFVISTAFMFGFMRPVVLRQDRTHAAHTASLIVKLLGRSLASSSFSLATFESLPSVT
jgi:TetR/AcrR family transcriptional regulator, regulator of cefoperazone and chloramphenicol sensitivity